MFDVDVEAVLLTGGRSQRMGSRKAEINIGGEPIALRIKKQILGQGFPVSILGPEEINDVEVGAGPLSAISRFSPNQNYLFVCACDIPLFDPRIIRVFLSKIDDYDAILPTINGNIQPLCGLFKSSTIETAKKMIDTGEKRLMTWVKSLNAKFIEDTLLQEYGLNPLCVHNANTPDEWARLLIQEDFS